MDRSYLIEWARRARGLTQVELAERAGTSQATLSAYERGVKSPSLKVAQRLLEATGHDINLRVHIDWVQHNHPDVVPFWSPNILWGVETPACFARLKIRDSLRDGSMRTFHLLNREERKRAYEILIQRHHPDEMIRWMDGALLVDVWDELDLPDPIREAWRLAVFIAREPFEIDAEWYAMKETPGTTSQAWIRRAERLRLPPSPPPRRSRFDPRPPPTS